MQKMDSGGRHPIAMDRPSVQPLLIMKLTVILLLMALFQVRASGWAQTIRLEVKDMPLRSVLSAIESQTGYVAVYNQRDLAHATTVTVHVRDMPLVTFLAFVLKDQPLTFMIEGKTIILSKKSPGGPGDTATIPSPPLIVIRGKVVDEDGKPLEGASIAKKHSSASRLSDAEGFFTINVNEGDVLVISYVEHKTREIKISAAMIASGLVPVTLAKTNSELDALRIIAYGTDSRRLGVGAVSTVTSAEISNQPVSNPLAALSGLAPGLNIGFTSGAPGAAVKVQIRGQNSLSQSSFGTKPFDQPLFIVNGVPVAAQNFNINALNSLAGSNYLDAYGGTSPFNGINPEDIESISVLRDAAATAIYGTQGANGVILITTKKGKAGKTRLPATVNTAFNTAARKPKLLNTQEYIAYRKEALENDGIDLATAAPTDYPDLLLFDQNKQTDWVDHYLGKTSRNIDAHASVSGGSERTTFFLSGGYTHSNYSFPGDFDYNRATLHSSIHHAGPGNKLTIDFGSDYSYERNYSSASPYAVTGIMTPPNFPDLIDPATGKLNWTYKGFNTGPYEQYTANLRQPNVLQAYNMTNSLAAGYAITKELKVNVNLGYSRITSDEAQQQPASTLNPANNPVSRASFGKSVFETINVEPQLNYQHSFGRGVLTALAGGTYRRNNTTVITLQGTNYTDEALLGSIGAAGNVQATDSYKPYRYAGAFARIGYVHDQKYIIQLSGRRDGSSNFGPGRQFGNFGSIGAGWIFSSEPFFKDALRFISYGKLSGSYGTTGTDATLPYQYQQLFSSSSNIPGFQGVKPLNVQNLFNPDYGWDTKKSLNIGLDLGFINDRILMNLNFYRERIGNQLVNYTLPSQTGFGAVLRNFDALVQNQGLEVNITSKNITGKAFSWTTTLNLSVNRNRLLAFPGLEQSSYGLRYTIGKSVNIVKGYRLKGVNPQDGIFDFYTNKGEATHNPIYGLPSQGGDIGDIANPDPKFIGGLANTLSYKRVSLSFLFQFQDQQQGNYLKSLYSGNMPGGFSNQPTAIDDRWRKPGDVNTLQRLTAGYGAAYLPGYFFTLSSGAYSSGSYIRLRTASLSYMLPAEICKKISISDARVFVSGQNLLLITGYKVGDPELSDLFSFPIQRTVALGITLNL